MAFRAGLQLDDVPLEMLLGRLFGFVAVTAITGIGSIVVGHRVARRTLATVLSAAVEDREFVKLGSDRRSFPGRSRMALHAIGAEATQVDFRLYVTGDARLRRTAIVLILVASGAGGRSVGTGQLEGGQVMVEAR